MLPVSVWVLIYVFLHPRACCSSRASSLMISRSFLYPFLCLSPHRMVSPSETGGGQQQQQYQRRRSSSSRQRRLACGLTNLGNTCYMNAVLQALYSSEPLRSYVAGQRASGSSTSLLSSLGRLFADMREESGGYTSPAAFRASFIRSQPKFRGYESVSQCFPPCLPPSLSLPLFADRSIGYAVT